MKYTSKNYFFATVPAMFYVWTDDFVSQRDFLLGILKPCPSQAVGLRDVAHVTSFVYTE